VGRARVGAARRDSPGRRPSLSLGPTYAAQAITAAGGSFGWRGRVAPGATVDTRVDASAERYDPGLYIGTVAPPGANRASVGGAVDAEWRPLERLALAGSARLDAWSDAASDGTHDSELRPTGHVGVEVPLQGLTIATHAGATARAPSFTERYGDRGAFIGDPSLRPESAWTVDAGARASRRLGAARVGLELVGFATWADDLITFVPTGAYGKAKATNIGRARLAGIEADARAALGPVDLRASYTGLLTANEGDAACTLVVGSCQRPPLPGRPAHDLVADAVGHVGPASLRVGVDAVTGIVTDLSGSTEAPPRVLVSAGARLDVTRGIRLAVDVRNLFDVRTGTYQGVTGPVREPIGDSYDYPLPGRSVLVSARFSEPGSVSP
jgi:outer membrane receptor protein involved in Fe transport